jgi:hypothetical protein
MSFAELKEQVASLSAKERFQLVAFLAEMEEQNEEEFRADVDRRMKAMDAGKKVTGEEFEARHRELKARGL